MPDETFPGAVVRMTAAVREHGILFIEDDGRITFRMTVKPYGGDDAEYAGRHIPDVLTDLLRNAPPGSEKEG